MNLQSCFSTNIPFPFLSFSKLGQARYNGASTQGRGTGTSQVIFHTQFYRRLFYLESMINLKIGGIIVAAFIAGAFAASPELRAYAAKYGRVV